jgi:hypothetical protein
MNTPKYFNAKAFTFAAKSGEGLSDRPRVPKFLT